MNLVFSDKYQQLFELLVAREKKSDESLTKKEREHYEKLSKVDTVLISGGRDSGKSFAASTFVTLGAKDYNHRVLYTRYTMSSTDHSISEAITKRMRAIGCESSFEYAGSTYQNKTTSGKIYITGQKTSSLNQTAKLKSLEDFSIFITDEAEEMKSYDEWYKINKSIRASDVQCLSILVFNPPTREHWIYEEFFEDMGVQEGFTGVKDNVMYIHTTYVDNIENVTEHNLRDYKRLKSHYEKYESLSPMERELTKGRLKKNWKKFKHVILGGFLDVAEGVIYEDWEFGEFDESLPFCYGLDFGSNDPDVLTKVAVDHKRRRIYIKEEYYKNNTSFEALRKILEDTCGFKNLIVADSADRRMIKDLWNGGLNIKKCSKGAGSVDLRIKTIQSYTLIIDKNSINLTKSLRNYCWHEKKSGIPEHEWSHAPDSFGYAAMELIR